MLNEEILKDDRRFGGVHCRWMQSPLTVPNHEDSKRQLCTDSERDHDGERFLHEPGDVRFHLDEIDIRPVLALELVQGRGPVVARVPPTFST